MSDSERDDGTRLVLFNPKDHDPIGDCVVCHNPVYPLYPENINDEEPVMHKECGL